MSVKGATVGTGHVPPEFDRLNVAVIQPSCRHLTLRLTRSIQGAETVSHDNLQLASEEGNHIST